VQLSELALSFASTLVSVLIISVPALLLFGRWIGSRLTKVTDAYGEERAKLLAQSHDLEKLIEQTTALTATTETIKAQLSGEEWGRQQRWLKRLDTYVVVVDALQKFQQATVHVQAYGESQRQHREAPSEVRIAVTAQFSEAMTLYNSATDQWTHAYSLAQLACANEAVRILRQFAIPTFSLSETNVSMPKARQLAAMVSAEFIAAARTDMGYEPLAVVTPLKDWLQQKSS
jgi:hypothetical protein